MVANELGAKDERIAVRLTRDKKSLIERAARLRGLSVSDFVVDIAWEAAKRDIEDEHVLRLTRDESIRFLAALDATPRKLDALRAAHARLREQTAS